MVCDYDGLAKGAESLNGYLWSPAFLEGARLMAKPKHFWGRGTEGSCSGAEPHSCDICLELWGDFLMQY